MALCSRSPRGHARSGYANRKKNRPVIVNEIHTENVASRILAWSADINNNHDHQILMITHAGLMISDLSSFSDWSLIIDEVLNPWLYDEMRCKLTADILAKYFSINKRRLSTKKDAIISDLQTETALNDQIPNLYNVAKRGKVTVTIDTFSTNKNWQWFSVWNFDQLKIFNQCYILANSFDHSTMYKLMQKDGSFTFNQLKLPSRHYERRDIIVRYFDDVNKASQSFFKSNEGKQALKSILDYYKDTPNDRIWTKNNENMDDLNCHGTKLKPKVAGSNDYERYTKATIIYSAKPSKQEQNIIDLFDIGVEEVVRARELETIIQFVTRTCIREPDDTRTCEFDVYDLIQATALKDYLEGLNVGLTVTLSHVNLGIAKRDVKPNGRPSTGIALTSTERSRKSRENKKIKENLKRLSK